MNYITTSILSACLFSTCVFAQPALNPDLIKKKNAEYLKSRGIEPLDSVISVVPMDEFIQKQSMGGNESSFINAAVKQYMAMHDEQTKNGFVKESNDRASELIHIQDNSNYKLQPHPKDYDPMETHLRASISDLKMAYTFIGVPQSLISESIGIAPMGGYKSIKNGDENDGWDGAIQYFKRKDLGNCAFAEHNLKLAQGGIQLIKELTTYEVQGKPTVVLVKGDDVTGYVYKVSWYDAIFDRELECATPSYSQNTTDAVLEMANAIDAN